MLQIICYGKSNYIYAVLQGGINNTSMGKAVYFLATLQAWDDMQIVHKKYNLAQPIQLPARPFGGDDYYPFGMQTADSWVADETSSNNYLFNASSELNKTTNNYQTFFRDYDPALGRMTGIDIMAGKYSSVSPYNYAFNDPVALNDPSGADPDCSWCEDPNPTYNQQWQTTGGGSSGLDWSGGHITPGSGGWADGSQYSDWTLFGGSEMYRQGRAQGYTERGGLLYGFDENGNIRSDPAQRNKGQWGYWEDSDAVDYSSEGTLWMENGKPVLINGQISILTATIIEMTRFVTLAQNDATSTKTNRIYVGLAGSVASEMYYSEKYGTWMGKDFKVRSTSWGGNGRTGGKHKYAGKVSSGIKWAGRGLGAYNAFNIYEKYNAGKITDFQLVIEQGSNTYSTLGGVPGAAWGVGWEIGRTITETQIYQNWKHETWLPWRYNNLGY